MISLILIFFIGSAEVYAQGPQYFTFAHSNCRAVIEFESNHFNERDQEIMKQEIMKNAQKKNFEVLGEITGLSGQTAQLTFKAKMYRSGFIYKNCHIELELHGPNPQAQITGGSRSIKLYEADINRQFPRVTFKGNERCTRAIADAFVHIPTCIKN